MAYQVLAAVNQNFSQTSHPHSEPSSSLEVLATHGGEAKGLTTALRLGQCAITTVLRCLLLCSTVCCTERATSHIENSAFFFLLFLCTNNSRNLVNRLVIFFFVYCKAVFACNKKNALPHCVLYCIFKTKQHSVIAFS